MEKQEDIEWVKAQNIVISTDLITATKKHLKFLQAVDDNGKLYDGRALERAIFRYKYCWLPLLAKHSRSKVCEWQLVVPLDCEWIWHCHRLNPVRYMSDCKELFGLIIDPCGVVISSVDGTSKKKTEVLWNTMYPEEPYELDMDDCFDDNDTKNKLMASPSTKYDLVSAVNRQSSFYYQVSRTFMKDDIFLEGAVERYKGFLHMIRRNMEMKSKNFCVPTYDIDLMWHTHQLHPLSYFNDTVSLLGKVLGHDDTDSDRTKGQKLDVGFSTTTKQWKEMFSSSRYWRAGAMYRYIGPVQGQSHHSIPNQSSNIMFMEILVEIIELRNLSSNHKGKLVLSVSKMQNDMLFKGKSYFSICKETEETQAVMFQCEPKGEFLFELVDDSSKSFGTCSISVLELDSKFPTPKWLEFDSDMSLPITLGIVITTTQPSPVQHMALRCGERKCNGICNTGFITARIGTSNKSLLMYHVCHLLVAKCDQRTNDINKRYESYISMMDAIDYGYCRRILNCNTYAYMHLKFHIAQQKLHSYEINAIYGVWDLV
ncbi:glycine-rich domain-containing protein-like protein [Artemisia annua]|uniref:Glycine-rich domain-containing protein-like protein n=1 Tax=Artemisia annua TaxID=35608 RepID=A0A2U1LX32_ARTAN|nr:glycine-rich domain-containing protein-like protein [Artemisia annua]